MVVGIIGAGASGMAAALAAAENPQVQVLLFERQARVGRKLQATGNGRCNLTNIYADRQGYHGQHPEFSQNALGAFSPEDTIAWFRELGLFTVTEESGRVYPYSDQANSVVDTLRFALSRPNIRLLTGFEVTRVARLDGEFSVSNGSEIYTCQKLIVACGGLAGTKLGGSLSGYRLLGKLGHKSTRLRPSLVQLKTQWTGVSALKGVRCNCKAEIYKDDVLFSQSSGELQFTEYGLSGPVIFELSRDVCQTPGNWECRLDFLPHITEEELFSVLSIRKERPCEELLTGILHNRLGRVLAADADVKGQQPVSSLTEDSLQQVCRNVKAFSIGLKQPMGMDCAQVTAGGILTEEFLPETLESRLVPGLYACGEVLDVDGDCGGYNLQWAWSSGRVAGFHAGKENG